LDTAAYLDGKLYSGNFTAINGTGSGVSAGEIEAYSFSFGGVFNNTGTIQGSAVVIGSATLDGGGLVDGNLTGAAPTAMLTNVDNDVTYGNIGPMIFVNEAKGRARAINVQAGATVSNSGFILVKAVQEQQAEIVTLESKVQRLEHASR
jgi:hypothetical protein